MGEAVDRREDSRRGRRSDRPSVLDDREEGLLEAGERERGDLIMDIGEDKRRDREGRMRSGVWGVEGLPWSWSQQSSQTRLLRMGDSGDS